MKIGIYTNPQRDSECKLCKELIEILKEKEIDYAICDNVKAYFDDRLMSFDEMAKNSDVVFAFGGDGTMLEVSVCCAKYDTPVFGINMGKLGFLTECSKDELKSAVKRLHNGEYTIERRAMLQVNTAHGEYFALNEAMLGSTDNRHIVVVDIQIDGTHADKVRGDGVIVSTPTGSTAYSLSCNGPILSPDVDALLITTVCPHTLHSRPIVIAGESTVVLKSQNKAEMRLLLDGRDVISILSDEDVRVKKSERTAKFVRLNKDNFYHRLLKKLSFWGD